MQTHFVTDEHRKTTLRWGLTVSALYLTIGSVTLVLMLVWPRPNEAIAAQMDGEQSARLVTTSR